MVEMNREDGKLFDRVVKSVLGIALAAGLMTTPLWSQQPSKKVKDQGEYDIYNAVLKAKDDPNKQIQLLQKWKESYADSDFKEDRAAMVAEDYAKLQKPAEAIKAAQDVLAINPKNLTALVTIVNNVRNVSPSTPDALNGGEQAANTLLSNLDSLKPEGVSDADWNAAKGQIAQIALTTLGWVKMQQKQWDPAEAAFRKVLQANPKSAQASYWLGSVLYAQKKYAPALYEFSRAVSYTGEGALPDAARQAADQYLKKAYVGYHGSEDGLDALKKQAAGAALPPDDLTIASVTDIAKNQQAAEQTFLSEHPDIKLWRELRDALKADGGEAYFNEHVKDALIPPQDGDFKQFKAKVVSMDNPKEIVVSVDETDGPNGDATLVFEAAVRGKLDPGAEISFAGAPASYTKDPYNIKFSVDRKYVSGLPAAGPSPARKTPMRKKQ
jgi:tetratricopeptide (TPR) repeat protein